MAELVGIHYSPWSLKARWALDLKRMPHTYTEYTPMLGEPRLRLKLKQLRGRVSVPAYIDGDLVLFDSFEIASYADKKGDGPALLPQAHRCSVHEWNLIGARIAAAGRAVVVDRARGDRGALLESVPSPLRRTPRLGATLGWVGASYIAHKYGARDAAGARDTLLRDLEAAAERVADRPYLVDGFTLADIAVATALEFVDPVSDAFVPIGPATRRTFTQDDLAARFPELLDWRDRVFAEHFVRRT